MTARRTFARILAPALLLGATASLGLGCGSVPIEPTYTQADLKTLCERQRGWWRPDDLLGGYCEFRGG